MCEGQVKESQVRRQTAICDQLYKMKRKKYEYIDKEDFLGYTNIVEVRKVTKVAEIRVGHCPV